MNLKEFRLSRNLTQQQVADHLGCSSVVYSRYENGSRQPSIDVLLALADLFDTYVDVLLGRGEPHHNLTDYERELLLTARTADARAREDALLILKSHIAAERTSL